MTKIIYTWKAVRNFPHEEEYPGLPVEEALDKEQDYAENYPDECMQNCDDEVTCEVEIEDED
jgi:hypothetical protein